MIGTIHRCWKHSRGQKSKLPRSIGLSKVDETIGSCPRSNLLCSNKLNFSGKLPATPSAP